MCVCVWLSVLGMSSVCVFLPPFIDSRREVTYVTYLQGCPFLPESGENCWLFLSPSTVGHGVGRGRRPCESLTVSTTCTCPVALVVGVVMAVEGVVLRI